mgnify:CR=1 FL=1
MNNKLLAEIFETYRGRRFLFMEPGGNWGDKLIYLGAEKLAQQFDLKFERVEYVDTMNVKLTPDDVVYIHGGGGFNSYSSGNSYRLLADVLARHKGVVIQGPCTVSDGDEVAAHFVDVFKQVECSDFVFFAREKLTFEIMHKLLPESASLSIDDDTALHLRKEDLVQISGVEHGSYDLVAIREDTEVAPNQSNLVKPGVKLDPAYFAQSFEHWVRLHAAARTITTNRTHSSIAGAILEIPTTLFEGAYHKNESIYNHSLTSKKVTWLNINTVPNAGPANRTLLEKAYTLLPGFLKDSWKVKMLLKRLQGVPIK